MTFAGLLTPAIVLVLWTLVMLVWTGATRFPAMARAGMDLKKATPGGRGQDLERVLLFVASTVLLIALAVNALLASL